MRSAAMMLATITLAACAGGAAPSGGVANLDALRNLQAACAASGMTMQLKSQGDPQRIDAYACVRK